MSVRIFGPKLAWTAAAKEERGVVRHDPKSAAKLRSGEACHIMADENRLRQVRQISRSAFQGIVDTTNDFDTRLRKTEAHAAGATEKINRLQTLSRLNHDAA